MSVSYPVCVLVEKYDTILDLWGVGLNRPPIDTHHPAVRTHPVTGLKALNINPGFVTGIADLNKKESANTDKLLEFFEYHLHSANDHYVRWKWAVGSVAMWDNRYANECLTMLFDEFTDGHNGQNGH